MNFITKIKEMPKKKLFTIVLLIIAIVATVTFAVVSSRRQEPDTQGTTTGTEQDAVSVFKPATDTQSTPTPADTAEPIDKSGVGGLLYVSHGDGTCHISGLGTCLDTDLKIPAYSPSGDVVTKISDSAFENCTSLLAVTIPSTVKTVGAGVFRGCANLVNINVDTENTVYTSLNGVLYSKDKKVLVAYPMNRPGSNFLLPIDTKAVAAYAFEGAINMKTILYEGTVSDFQKIDFLMGNGIIDKVAITCNYRAAK